MEPKHPFFEAPHVVLKDLLIEKKLKNTSYSARAFAKHLGLSQAFLSQVMNEKRKLSLEQKIKIADLLRLVPEVDQSPAFEAVSMTIEHEKILKHWYHFVILELTKTRKLSHSPGMIAKVLGISELEASDAVQRLLEFGYLKLNQKNVLIQTKLPFVIDAKKSSRAMRTYHQSRLRAAEAELEQFEEFRVEQRQYLTLFIPTSRARVQSASKLVEEFQHKLTAHLMAGSNADEVFQFSLQIFSAEKNPNQNKTKGNSK